MHTMCTLAIISTNRSELFLISCTGSFENFNLILICFTSTLAFHFMVVTGTKLSCLSITPNLQVHTFKSCFLNFKAPFCNCLTYNAPLSRIIALSQHFHCKRGALKVKDMSRLKIVVQSTLGVIFIALFFIWLLRIKCLLSRINLVWLRIILIYYTRWWQEMDASLLSTSMWTERLLYMYTSRRRKKENLGSQQQLR